MNVLTGSLMPLSAKLMILILASANCSLIFPFAIVLIIFFNFCSELLNRKYGNAAQNPSDSLTLLPPVIVFFHFIFLIVSKIF